MTEFAQVGTGAFLWMILGAALFLTAPAVIAIVWKIRKEERFTTILIGAATFLLFALILEKPIQNVLLFPTAMGMKAHAVSRFFDARPVLLALMAGLFPGVFEETGRLVAFRTVLKKRTNRETSVSHGIGHGGFEIMLLLGMTYITYLVYAVMINTGAFEAIAEQVAVQAPEQLESVKATAELLATFSWSDLLIAVVERVFALLFHVGASILVFYACRDRKKAWCYPLAILLHTAMDFIAALQLFHLIALSAWELEAVVGAFALLTFFGAYLLLYRKDTGAAGQTA